MSPALLFALLIIATPVLFFVVVTVNASGTGAPTLFIPATPAPALDERDLLDTDPREWVRQAEHAVEFEEGGMMDHMDSLMQMQRDIAQRVDDRRPRDPAPRFTCVICGAYGVAHIHNLETTNHETRIDR